MINAWHGNDLQFLIVGFALNDIAMSNCRDQKGGATVVLAAGNWASSRAEWRSGGVAEWRSGGVAALQHWYRYQS